MSECSISITITHDPMTATTVTCRAGDEEPMVREFDDQIKALHFAAQVLYRQADILATIEMVQE